MADRLYDGSPYAIRPFSCLSVCLSVLSVTLVHCGQTAGWIKMKLGMQVSIGPGRIVLDGTQLPRKMGIAAPQFSSHVYCGQTAGCIKMYGGRSQARRHCVRCYPATLQKRRTPPPNFPPMSIVIKRLPISADVELLFSKSGCHSSAMIIDRRKFITELDGCIVWNAGPTIQYSALSAWLSVPLSKWVCPKITCGQSNLT